MRNSLNMTDKTRKKRYFITGGGTGGHIYPAVAVADYLYNQGNSEIFYIGNPKNMEHDIVSQKAYTFLPIKVQGMPRKLKLRLIPWAVEVLFAVIQAGIYIIKYKPDVILGTGGYVSAPALMAGKFLRIPYVMHDCDANPGIVTRKLSPWASAVSLAFECAKDAIRNKNCHVNGNPIREKFKTLTKDEARKNLGLQDKLTLCIMGGSQGANSINNAAVEILKTLSKEFDMQIIFQTGKKNFAKVEDKLSVAYPDYKDDKNLVVRPYFDDMVTVLKSSDIAVSRAGSLSISELNASNIATIFIPYPFAAADHQRRNAKFMVEKGAGLYLEDSEITGETLLALIKELAENKEKLQTIQENAKKLAVYDGTEKIAKLLN